MKMLLLMNLVAMTIECYLLSNIIHRQPPVQPIIIEIPLSFLNSAVTTQLDCECFGRMVEMIKRFESFKPIMYTCAGGKQTIGYGFTDAKYLKMKRMTESQASKILVNEVIPRYQALVRKHVKVPLTINQECALVSFTYNCGEGSLVKVVDARLNRLNKGNYHSVSPILLQYTKVRVGNKIKTLNGLVTRREHEAAMFEGKVI